MIITSLRRRIRTWWDRQRDRLREPFDIWPDDIWPDDQPAVAPAAPEADRG